ncbi:hypothetical protein [Amycolatopsis sp.]|jgi:hypothetical protein|uniref:hypothetical protein n=1 Tax=Amycolatopsis sp. TaxID=37632 RepID=UPI002E057EBB|nr:hypothetical protein [Amycolatopsis sp.]
MTFTVFAHQSQQGHRVGWESDIEDRDLSRTQADLAALEPPEAPTPRRKPRSRLQMLLDPLHFGA